MTMNLCFIDSNIFIYSVDTTSAKALVAQQLLNTTTNKVISVQVINEFTAVMRRKKALSWEKCEKYCAGFINECRVIDLKSSTALLAFQIIKRYHFSYWDSLIVAAALQAGCGTLYSEDMQHQQRIAHEPYTPLTIINPFLNTA